MAVHLGTASAVTGADGVALVPVTEAGTLELVADKDGMVRSFPREVRAGVRRALALLICLAPRCAGCGFGAGRSRRPRAGSLTVTRDFGDVVARASTRSRA